MNDIPTEWLDWLAVFGYLGFTALIIWRVFTNQQQKP